MGWITKYEQKFKITLGEEQIEVLNKVTETLLKNRQEQCYTEPICIGGAAGVGKSLITKFILNWALDNIIPTVLCAPTHKAALVLRNYANYPVTTIHSLLALSPKIDILLLDIRQLQFFTNEAKDNEIPYNGLVICDEASMVSSDLFDLLVEKCSALKTCIIFIADYAQLNPVKEKNLSKVFTCKNNFRLTKIYRQSEKNALLSVLQTLRETPVYQWNNSISTEGSLIVEPDIKSFCNKVTKEYRESISEQNILHTKILAYTNNRVEKYNKVIHNFLFGNKNLLNVGEILMAYDNYKVGKYDIVNAMDYIVEDISHEDIVIPYYRQVDGYQITIYDEYNRISFIVPLISPEESNIDLAYCIDSMRVRAINAQGRNKGLFWRKYYQMLESFCTFVPLMLDDRCIRKPTFQYGYAITVHKSQGSSYDNIFLDMKDILKAQDEETLRQLQYVGLSRTRNNATILI